jgi:hypothetical protein
LWRNDPLLGNGSVTHSRGNEHTGNNRRTTVSMQLQSKRTSIIIDWFLGYGVLNVFSVRGPCRRFIKDSRGRLHCNWYNWATLFLGDINTGTWPSRLGESRIWECKLWSWVPRDSDLRMTPLARASSNCKRQTHPLVREDVTWGPLPQMFSWKKIFGMGLKSPDAKTNWLAVSRQSQSNFDFNFDFDFCSQS